MIPLWHKQKIHIEDKYHANTKMIDYFDSTEKKIKVNHNGWVRPKSTLIHAKYGSIVSFLYTINRLSVTDVYLTIFNSFVEYINDRASI